MQWWLHSKHKRFRERANGNVFRPLELHQMSFTDGFLYCMGNEFRYVHKAVSKCPQCCNSS